MSSKRVSSQNSNGSSLSQNILNSLTPSSIATALLSSATSSSSSSSSTAPSTSSTTANTAGSSSSSSTHSSIAANANSNSPSIIHKTISSSNRANAALASSASSTRSSTSARSVSERSNEVPPSDTSAGIVTLRQTSTSSASSSRSANDFAAHFDNIDPPLKQPITPRSSASLSNAASSATADESRRNELTIMQRMKKRPLAGLLNAENDSELICPICFDIIRAAHVTKCGHSFCQTCIQTALEHSHRCPKCNTSMSMSRDVFPNFALNQIIERFKEETNSKKVKFNQTV